MAFLLGGGYAEYALASPFTKTPHGALVDTGNIIELPDRVSFSQGLIYLLNLRVAYLLSHVTADVKPGAFTLLHAASGGIGTLMTGILKRQGARVIALSSSDEKLKYCRENGADYGINYKEKDYVKDVMEITEGKGVDISFNSVAGPTLKADPKAIKPFGLLVVYGEAAGRDVIDPFETMIHKALTVKFSSIYSFIGTEAFREATEFLENWLKTEKLDSVTKIFKLEDAAQAHRWFEDGHAYGKIVLEP
ncbi:zinc-binding alcohol dehydrogenase family protein [Thermodesulfobacteriota bacterium]